MNKLEEDLHDPIAAALRGEDDDVFFFPPQPTVKALTQAPHKIEGPKTEKPVHRLMALLYARGVSPKDIAAQVGYSVVQTRSILRSPHMREVLAELVHQNFDNGAKDLLQSGVIDAIETLKYLCTEPTVPASVRRASARDILEMVDINRSKPLTAKDILDQLDQEREGQ
jgi:hypothetical protein